ncbi:two-component sensor histidine kinase [Actinoplanes sp. NBRC 103695]|nr:two-component sensor histidine kinase [Actinoplanes sp. NBRC 103695]
MVVDTTAAAVLAWLAVSATLDPPGPRFDGPPWVAWLAGIAVGLPIAFRRRWPLPVLVWVVVTAAVATVSGVVGAGVIWVTWLPVAFALYTGVIAAGRGSVALALIGTFIPPATTVPLLYARAGIDPADAPASEAPLWWQVETGSILVMLTATWVLGWTIRWRRSVHADLARRLAEEAVAAERLRIARELHDIVGHSLSLIAAKATIANQIGAERPSERQSALLMIEETSRSAVTEVRRVLGILRTDDDPAAALAPPPGVAGLSELAEPLRSAGHRVELTLDGVDDLPPTVELTTYRIVQESLTNVLKHADAGRCEVTVRAREGRVRVEIINDGRPQRPSGRRPTSRGQGHIGMRERVAMYGGTLTAGPRPEGGFQVVADFDYAVAEEIP